MPLLRYRGYGAGIDTLLMAAVSVRRGSGFSPGVGPGTSAPTAAPLPDGLLAVAGDIPEFRIRILSADGRVVRVICLVTPALPLSDGERGLVAEGAAVEPEARRARIGRMFSDDAGRIWVQRDRVSGVLVQDRWFGPRGATFEIVDHRGHAIGRVRAPPDTRLAAAHGDQVFGLRTDSRGLVSVVAFGWRE
jgi:hypothetical protein